jgi:MFS family permease
MEMLRNPVAWHIACCFITTTVGGMYLAGTFKTYGQATFHDEAYLSSISSISSVFNALGRIFWGHMADRFGAMRVLFGMSSIFSAIIASYALSPLIGQWAFALWTWAIFFFEGGNFVLYVPIVVQQFGSKHSASNYGLIFSSYSLFVVVNITLLADSGWSFLTTTLLMGLLTFIGFVNLLLLDRHIRSSKKLTVGGQSECKVT